MKKLFNLLLSVIAFICITSISSINTYADEKKYEIPNASFYVTLLENGDARVTEVWQAKYTSGNFTRFYKDIYKINSKVESFSNIEIEQCKINGKNVSLAESMNREHNHYYLENTTDRYTINWFYEASNETVKYEITYLISDIVKKTDKNKAIFYYRFIGENFTKRVENTYVEIKTPKDTDIELNYTNDDSNKKSNNSITLQEKNVDGLLKYGISMDPNIFDDLETVSFNSSDFKKNNKTADFFTTTLEKLIFFVFMLALFIPFLIPFIIPIGLIIIDYFKQKKFEKFMQENPTYVNQLIKKYESIHPLVWLSSNRKKPPTYQTFIIILLDLCRRNKAYISKNQILINKPDFQTYEFEQSTINVLLEHFEHEDSGHYYAFNLEHIDKTLEDKSIAKNFTTDLISIYRTLPKDANYTNKEDYKLLTRFYKTYKSNYNSPLSDYFKLIERNHTIDYILVLGFAFVSTKKCIVSDSEFSLIENVCNQFEKTFIYSNHSSGHSGHDGYGCSSCGGCGSSCGGCGGGCGGCGGGGAD